MNLKYYLAVFLTVIIVFWIIHGILKSKCPFIKAIVSSTSGIITLAVIEGFSAFTGIIIPLNSIVIICSMLLGFPGVGLILILNSFFK